MSKTDAGPGCARGETKTAPALADVVAERRRQDQQWGGPDHDDDHSPADWMSYIHYQLQKLQKEGPGDIFRFRERMVKVAALAVAAIEYSDRDLVEWPRESKP